ncbi:MAG: hypothetical protein U1C47_03165 [Hydrogenophaga sp.]|nr:hypothetical protein [Hydrogenophaga sp.]
MKFYLSMSVKEAGPPQRPVLPCFVKVLKDCYANDFSSLVAEINFDFLPWDLKSEQVSTAHYHIAKHSLHTAEERSMFSSS